MRVGVLSHARFIFEAKHYDQRLARQSSAETSTRGQLGKGLPNFGLTIDYMCVSS